jgi:hypothetical protein
LTRRRVTTREAAEVLGISIEAVRKRIERGQLDHDREDNRVYVYMDDDRTKSGRDVEGEEANALVETLREQVAYLRGVIATRDQELALRAEEVRRRDAALEREQQLTAFFAERLREIEAPRGEPRDAPEAREDAPQSPPSPGPAGTTADAGEGQETAADATDRGNVRGDHSEAQEAQEERVAWHKKWEHRLLLVLIAIVSLSALLYLALPVLSP